MSSDEFKFRKISEDSKESDLDDDDKKPISPDVWQKDIGSLKKRPRRNSEDLSNDADYLCSFKKN